jgi:hypothetical protein
MSSEFEARSEGLRVISSEFAIRRMKDDEFVKSLLSRHPGESRGPELVEFTGFRRSPE